MLYKILIISLLSLFVFTSCVEDNNKKEQNKDIDYNKISENLIKVNSETVALENKLIDDWIKRKNARFEETKTGLRYKITGDGIGNNVKIGQKVTYSYNVSLLTGEQIYSSLELGNKSFILGKNEAEAGLVEGLQLMKQGQKAIFIIPYYYAHGMLGDMEKIPPQNSIIYELNLLKIE